MKKLGILVATILALSAFIVTEVVADDWSGPYAGLQAGYVWGDADTGAFNAGEPPAYSLSFDVDGFVGGIYAGYMWQFGNDIRIGIEGDGNFLSSADDKITIEDEPGFIWGGTAEQKWDASLRLIAGKQMGDYLFFCTGGMAWTEVKIIGYADWKVVDPVDENSEKLFGWTLGAGVEKKINENIRGRIQYRYSDYGDETWNMDNYHDPYVTDTNDFEFANIEYTSHLLTVGLSYYF